MKIMTMLFATATAMLIAAAGCDVDLHYGDGGAGDAGLDGSTDAGKRNKPEDSFFIPVAEKDLVAEFSGPINLYEDVLDGRGTNGLGTAELMLGAESAKLGEPPVAYRYKYPDDYFNPDLRGRDYVMGDFQKVLESRENGMHYIGGRFGLEAGALVELEKSGEQVMNFAKPSLIDITDVTVTNRKDKTVLRRMCHIAVLDPVFAGSKVFVNWDENDSFGPGEKLKVWLNTALTTDRLSIETLYPGQLSEDGGYLCAYYMDSEKIDKKTYETEIKKTFDLECPIPDGFTVPVSEQYLIQRFKGIINNLEDKEKKPVEGVSDSYAFIAGKKTVVDDYRNYAGEGKISSRAVITAESYGDVVEIEKGHFRFNITRTSIPLEVLASLENGGSQVQFDGGNMFSSVAAIEQKILEDMTKVKFCPRAVLNVSSYKTMLYVCRRNNPEYAAGEMLQFAGNIVMTDNPKSMRDYFGMKADCYCYDDLSGEFDCKEF